MTSAHSSSAIEPPPSNLVIVDHGVAQPLAEAFLNDEWFIEADDFPVPEGHDEDSIDALFASPEGEMERSRVVDFGDVSQRVVPSGRFFPFDSAAQGVMLMLRNVRPTTSKRKTGLLYHSLPLLGVDRAKLAGCSGTSLGRLADGVPGNPSPFLPIEDKEATAYTRIGKLKRKKELRDLQRLPGGLQAKDFKIPVYRQVRLTFQYMSLLDYAIRDLRDPTTTLRFGLEQPPKWGPDEFNQTPFAHKHLLYQKLLSFNIELPVHHTKSVYAETLKKIIAVDSYVRIEDEPDVYYMAGARFRGHLPREVELVPCKTSSGHGIRRIEHHGKTSAWHHSSEISCVIETTLPESDEQDVNICGENEDSYILNPAAGEPRDNDKREIEKVSAEVWVRDFVKTKNDSGTIFRIEELKYEPPTDEDLLRDPPRKSNKNADEKEEKKPPSFPWAYRDYLIPKLQMRLTRFNILSVTQHNLQPLKGVNEVVQATDTVEAEWLPVTDITGLCTVNPLMEQPIKKSKKSIIDLWKGAKQNARQRCSDDDSLYFCRYQLTDHNRHTFYIPFELQVHSPFVADAKVKVLWAIIFIDKYKSANINSAQSFEGVYLRWGNVPKRLWNSPGSIKVLANLPPGVKTEEVMALFRRDMERGAKGVKFITIDGTEETFYVMYALQVQDSIQAYDTVCHGGNNSTRCSRSSWIKLFQRHLLLPILDHTLTRRWAQTLIVKDAIEREGVLRKRTTPSAHAEFRRSYGVRNNLPNLYPPGIDPHLTGNFEGSHLLDAHFMPLVFSLAVKTLDTKRRAIFRQRLNYFNWPVGFPAPNLSWNTTGIPDKHVSWTHIKRLACAARVCLCGLQHKSGGTYKDQCLPFFQFFLRLTEVAFELMGPVRPSRYSFLQSETDSLVTLGCTLIGDKHKKDVGNWIVPNLIGLREFVHRVLPMLGNCSFLNSGGFEGTHKYLRALTGKGGTRLDTHAMRATRESDGWAYIFRGGRWGPTCEMRASTYWRTLELQLPNLPPRPHPLRVAITNGWYSNTDDISGVRNRACVHPSRRDEDLAGISWVAHTIKQDRSPLQIEEQKILEDELCKEANLAGTDAALISQMQWVDSIRADGHHHLLQLSEGATVKCKYADSRSAYMTIDRILLVEYSLPTRSSTVQNSLWIYPSWYETLQERKECQTERSAAFRDADRKRKKFVSEAYKTYRPLHATFLHPRPPDGLRTLPVPVPAGCILSQVIIAHACVFTLKGGSCTVTSACVEHGPGCTVPLCLKKDTFVHDYENNTTHVVLDGRQGFRNDYRVNKNMT